MPINEAVLLKRSNLTAEQRFQAEASIYGLAEGQLMAPESLSHDEISRMRQILAEHDAHARPPQTFDLNNPPKLPYRHQEFPKMVYMHEGAEPARNETRNSKIGEELVYIPAKVQTLTVHDAKELEKALKKGFKETPPVFDTESVA